MKPCRIGSLFSGIGGLELGLEWAGLGPVVWQVEQEPFARAVLAKHWPNADRSITDVCAAGLSNLAPVDIICGGFPCQDISVAGKGAGLAGEHSGLWREYARIVGELRPRFVVVENVSALLGRGASTVLGDLAALGYDAIWTTLRASDVGAPHRRERLFIVAYRQRDRLEGCEHENGGEVSARERRRPAYSGIETMAYSRLRSVQRRADGGSVGQEAREGTGEELQRQWWRNAAGDGSQVAAVGHATQRGIRCGEASRASGQFAQPSEGLEHAESRGCETVPLGSGAFNEPRAADRRQAEPRLGRELDGLSSWMDRWPTRPGETQHAWEAPRTAGTCDNRAARLKALGNAVVPQVAYVVGMMVRELL